VVLLITSSGTASETFFRCPYDPIQPYFAANSIGGMNRCARGTGGVGGYVTVMTDADGFIDAMSNTTANLNVYHVGTIQGETFYA
jgi:hypothetical protein